MPLRTAVAVKNTVALARERWDVREVARRRGVSPRRTAAGAGPWDLSPRLLWALAGELAAVIALFASGNASPVLVAVLQLFLRF